jgi:hypothetical protein
MKVIVPQAITPAMVTACNVPETDYTAWSSGTAYVVGNRCMYDHKNYECLINHTNAQPDQNVVAVVPTSPKWLDLGYNNRWKMFDTFVGSQASQADLITVTLQPGVCNSLAFLDIQAGSIGISITTPGESTFTETIDLVNRSLVVDAFTYFMRPVIANDTAVMIDVPIFGTSSVALTFTSTGGTVKVGTIVCGTYQDIGSTQYAPTVGITDYSRKDVDTFGIWTVIQRAYAKRMSCELLFPNTSLDAIQRYLADIRSTPVVWIGCDSGYSAMVIYGFYRSFQITIPYPLESLCSIEVEGLA